MKEAKITDKLMHETVKDIAHEALMRAAAYEGNRMTFRLCFNSFINFKMDTLIDVLSDYDNTYDFYLDVRDHLKDCTLIDPICPTGCRAFEKVDEDINDDKFFLSLTVTNEAVEFYNNRRKI